MAKAYGSLTVVDLLDTATYIYYATDGNGSNAAISPVNKQYIGIYSGPPLDKGQPAPNSSEYNKIKAQIVWSKYHGEKGDKGDTGNGISENVIRYNISTSGTVPPQLTDPHWQEEVPKTNPTYPYLWTRIQQIFTDGNSNYSYSVSSNLEGVEIGGRNLLRHSKGKFILPKDTDSIDSQYLYYTFNDLTEKFVVGQTYTVSAKVKVLKGNFNAVSIYFFKEGELRTCPIDSEGRISLTAKITSSATDSVLIYAGVFGQTANQSIEITDVKIERGNKVTSWTPAPEDLYQEIETSSFILESSVDEMVKFFGKGYSVPYYTLNSLSFTVVAKNQKDCLAKDEYTLEITYNGDRKVYSEIGKSLQPGQEISLTDFPREGSNTVQDPYRGEGFFVCRLKDGDRLLAVKTVYNRYGTTRDMAKFQVNAADINASVQSAALRFSSDGLSLYNGGIKIYSQKQSEIDGQTQPALFFDPKTKQYCFNGTVIADSGVFKGVLEGATIKSLAGTIGGFTITSEQLVSSNRELVFDGNKGVITAKNINLGENAKVTGQINVNDKIYIKGSGTNAGTIQVGTAGNCIWIDGTDGSIKSLDGGTTSWKLSKDEAFFKNVTISGALESCVIKRGEVQAVGGILVVRPSSTIKKKTDSQNYELEDATGFVTGGYCRVKTAGKDSTFQIEKVTNNTIKTKTPVSLKVGDVVLSLGNPGDVAIGINASGNSSFMPQQAITVSTLDNNGQYIHKIIMGQLSGIAGYEGKYGLYADNAILEGSLVTKHISEQGGGAATTYSGMSTKYNVNGPKTDEGDVLIWAGAKGESPSDIQRAPFIVDTKGNIFCNKGHFEGGVFSNTTIEASQLSTATIIGTGLAKDGLPALTIKDGTVEFYDKKERFIRFEKDDSFIKGEITLCQVTKATAEGLQTSKVTVVNSLGKVHLTSSGLVNEGNMSLFLGTDGVVVSAGNQELQIKSNQISAQCPVSFKDSIYYSDNKEEYRPAYSKGAVIGYDLFVRA